MGHNDLRASVDGDLLPVMALLPGWRNLTRGAEVLPLSYRVYGVWFSGMWSRISLAPLPGRG
jgi:hypothetical protein